MIPQGLKHIEVKELLDWVTDVNARNLPKAFARRMRGIRPVRTGYVLQPDYGTIHRYSEYPAIEGHDGQLMRQGHTLHDIVENEEYEIIPSIDPDNGNTRLWAGDTTPTGNWEELTRILICTIGSINGQQVTLSAIQNDLEDVVSIAPNALIGWVVRNNHPDVLEKNKYAMIVSNTASAITLLISGTADGSLGWSAGHTLTLARSSVLWNGYEANNGSNPHLEFVEVEERRKVFLLYGDSNNPPTRRVPLAVERHSERPLFFGENEAAQLTLPEGFYTELGGGLIPSYVQLGSPNAPWVPPNPLFEPTDSVWTAIPDPDGNDWLFIETRYEYPDIGSENNNFQKICVTAVFNGYQESDPIFRVFAAKPSGVSGDTVSVMLKFFVHLGKMPKNITSLRVYRANILQSDLDESGNADFTKWAENAADYILYYEAKFDIVNDFTLAVGDPWWGIGTGVSDQIPSSFNPLVTAIFPEGYINTRHNLGERSLLDSLGHQPKYERSRVMALYGDRVRGAGGTLVVLEGIASDGGEALYISTIDGSGAVCDNNFTEQTTDLANRPLFIPLPAKGTLKGVKVAENFIAVGYSGVIILHDLKTGVVVQVIQADIASRRSLFSLGTGIAMGGYRGLYMLTIPSGATPDNINWKDFAQGSVEPAGSNLLVLINPRWKNFYDERLLAENDSPFMTDTNREAVVSGFDPMFRRLLVAFNARSENGLTTEHYIVGFDGQSWNPRIVPFEVKWFSKRKDNTLTIGTENAILKYPNLDTGNIFEDMVGINGASPGAGFGIDNLLLIDFGELYSLSTSIIPYSVFIDHEGESIDGNGYFFARWYRNGYPTPEEQRFPLDRKPGVRGLERRGPVRHLELELSVPTAQSANHRDFGISEVSLGYVAITRPGVPQ